MASYAHDADVIVYNYDIRSPATIQGFSASEIMNTTAISLRDSITAIQCNKTKSSPQGSFSINLKPTKDWAQILIPGSWCAIFMTDRPLTDEDYSSNATAVMVQGKKSTIKNVISPLKMIGMIMSVRVQKVRNSDGTITVSYSICGYDFGYVFTSQIYINALLQNDLGIGTLQPKFADLTFATNINTFANPAVNVKRVLSAWSSLSSSASPFSITSVTQAAAPQIHPPSIKMQIPKDLAELFGGGVEILSFITPCIGIDRRESKVIKISPDGTSGDFDPELIGEKAFNLWQLILHNSLWGMINEFSNPLMNETYCDLHPTTANSSIGGAPAFTLPEWEEIVIKPLFIMRQKPFNTPNYDRLWTESLTPAASGIREAFPVTKLHEIARTAIVAEKILSFDVGYSEYERVNFAEINGFLMNGPQSGQATGPFNAANLPAYSEESIIRFGLRPMIHMGTEYGITSQRIEAAGLWRPLLVDWWFNTNKFASGTVECIGLSEHIALGENIELVDQGIVGHIEAYSHNFMVDTGTGNRIFRTSIEFSKGISSESKESKYKYIYGGWDEDDETSFGVGGSFGMGGTEETSIVTEDVKKRVSFTPGGKRGLDIK